MDRQVSLVFEFAIKKNDVAAAYKSLATQTEALRRQLDLTKAVYNSLAGGGIKALAANKNAIADLTVAQHQLTARAAETQAEYLKSDAGRTGFLAIAAAASVAEKAQGKVTKEMAKLQKAARFQSLIAEQGKFVGGLTYMKERTKAVQDQTSRFGLVAAVTFAAGVASIKGFVGAASPEAMAAFNGWFKVLSAEIGTIFVPYIAKAAGWVRDLADWFGSLSDATKKWIGVGSLAALGILAIGLAVPKLIGLFGGLFSAIKGVSIAFSWIYANPVLVGLALIAAAIAYVAFSATKAEKALAGTKDAIARLNAGDVKPEDIAGLSGADQEKFKAVNDKPEERAAFLADLAKRAKEEEDRAKKAIEKFALEDFQVKRYKREDIFSGEDAWVKGGEVANKDQRASAWGRTGKIAVPDWLSETSERLQQELADAQKKAALAKGLADGKGDGSQFGGGSKGQFMGLEDIRKQAIMASLMTPYEARTLQIQDETRRNTQQLVANTNPSARPPTPPAGMPN